MKNYNSVLGNNIPRPRKTIVGENNHVNSITLCQKIMFSAFFTANEPNI